MKIFGVALCLGIIAGAAATVGIHLYFDMLSFVVPSGGIVFLCNSKIGPAVVLSPLIILYGFAINKACIVLQDIHNSIKVDLGKL